MTNAHRNRLLSSLFGLIQSYLPQVRLLSRRGFGDIARPCGVGGFKPADLKGEYAVVPSGVPVGVGRLLEVGVEKDRLGAFCIGDPVNDLMAKCKFGRCRNGGGGGIAHVEHVLSLPRSISAIRLIAPSNRE